MANLGFAIATATLLAAAQPPSELVVKEDGLVSGSVNGVPMTIRIDPAAPAAPLLTSAAASRAGLRSGPFSFEYQVGPRRVTGETAVGRIDIGHGPQRRRLGWAFYPFRPGSDAVIGPGLLPYRSIRFQLRAPQPGEVVTSLRMVSQAGLDAPWGARYGLITVDGQPMRVMFDPLRRRSLASANAGSRLARSHGAQLSGAVSEREIAFGVRRPVRDLVLARPLSIGTLPIRDMGVRTTDFGSVRHVREAGKADPDEIVVTARGRRSISRDHIILGNDVLGACSSITFDRERRQIRLSCRVT